MPNTFACVYCLHEFDVDDEDLVIIEDNCFGDHYLVECPNCNKKFKELM